MMPGIKSLSNCEDENDFLVCFRNSLVRVVSNPTGRSWHFALFRARCTLAGLAPSLVQVSVGSCLNFHQMAPDQ